MKTDLKPGDWVRVLRNEVGASSQEHEGLKTLIPYEAVKVLRVEARSTITGHQEAVVVFAVARTTCYVYLKDVEKLEECICARPLIKSCGCRCGYQYMMEKNK